MRPFEQSESIYFFCYEQIVEFALMQLLADEYLIVLFRRHQLNVAEASFSDLLHFSLLFVVLIFTSDYQRL